MFIYFHDGAESMLTPPYLPCRREGECILQWHGHQPGRPDWSNSTNCSVAFSMILMMRQKENSMWHSTHKLLLTVALPDRYRLDPLLYTTKLAPYDFSSEDLLDRATAVRQFENFVNLYPMLS